MGSLMSFQFIPDVIPLCCTSANQEQLSVECVDEPMGLNAVIVTGDQEFPLLRMLQGEDNDEAKGEEDPYM